MESKDPASLLQQAAATSLAILRALPRHGGERNSADGEGCVAANAQQRPRVRIANADGHRVGVPPDMAICERHIHRDRCP